MSNPTIYDLFHPQICDSMLLAKDAPLFVGLECEIESIRHSGEGDHLFKVTNDGSLRNHGLEFISNPISIDTAIPLFKELHGAIALHDADLAFSERTSIHVHVNCANIPQDEVKNIILMYALFEEFFFRLVHPDRRHNIHCVPLTETYLPVYYKSDLNTLVSKWHKYTALNIKPLTNLGTIEFRHMQGHNDEVLLDQWLGTINNLVQVARTNPINQMTLDGRNIKDWFSKIFVHSHLRLMDHLIPSVAFNSILDMKLAVM